MNSESISVSDAADELGMLKPTAFKILRRLGITPTKEKSDQHRGQAISFITRAEFEQLAHNYTPPANGEDEPSPATSEVFYVIQLEPEFDPGRFKLGFTNTLESRLRHHRCSAPFAIVIQTWPCKQLWEKTAIDSIAQGCEQLHTEVFRAESIDLIVERASAFLSRMPSVDQGDLINEAERGSDGNG